MRVYLNGVEAEDRPRAVVGPLSGKRFVVPDVNAAYPRLHVTDRSGAHCPHYEVPPGLPDTRSHRLKLGLLVPATNSTVESEMWELLMRDRTATGGVGIHTGNIHTPAPRFADAEELAEYRRLFAENLDEAADRIQLSEPEYLILGFSMEHFSADPAENAELPDRLARRTGLGVATWADAARAALGRLGAGRIALLCPFDPSGLANAAGLFEALGFEVVEAVGLGCASGTDVGHVPD
ncbi:MAG: hypothetical protein AAFZ65_20870, partial [Planctomycetota bacterium]